MLRQERPKIPMRVWTLSMGALVLSCAAMSACGKSEPAADKEKVPTLAAPRDAVAVSTPAAVAELDAGLKVHMQEHFDAIRVIERAIVVGDTESAKEQARWLAEHATLSAVAKYPDEVKAVQIAAQALVHSESLALMASGAAHLASLCGGCHLATTSVTSFEWTPAPAENGGAKERMQRHLWAMDRLWEGLVGPSDMSWQEGAAVLLSKPFPAEALLIDGRPLPDAEHRLRKITALAKEASGAARASDRARVYGELLATCSACHAQFRR